MKLIYTKISNNNALYLFDHKNYGNNSNNISRKINNS